MFNYLSYLTYQPLLEEFNIEYLEPLSVINHGNYEDFVRCTEKNNFLIQDDLGVGEGVVIKNYDFFNKRDKQVWAKIVTSEFKEKQHKIKKPENIENKMIEENVVEEFITTALIEKEYAKIINDEGSWTPRLIPKLLNMVYYSIVTEEIWNIVKKYKNPKIDFKYLKTLITSKIKDVKSELF